MKLYKKILLIIVLFSIISLIIFSNSVFASSDQAASYVSTEISSSNGIGLAGSSVGGTFVKLGYNVVTPAPFQTTNSKSTVLSYINSSSTNYGFAVISHGSGNSSISRFNMNTSTGSSDAIYPSNISGNWHLVILNSCNSLAGPSFANAFKTTSAYSNRGILGWYNTVTFSAVGNFWYSYYQKAGTMTLRNAALAAASECSESTPTRFYGDTSWYGWAW